MQNKIIKTMLVLAMFLILPKNSYASVLFETNFDSISDWNTNGALTGCGEWSGGQPQCSSAPPTGFTGYYTEPYGGQVSAIPGGLTDHTGGTAKKAWISIYPNSTGGNINGNGWTNGSSMLSKTLSSDYPELYSRFYSRVSPSWCQGVSGNGSTSVSTKFFRLDHFDRTGNEFTYFGAGYSTPIALVDMDTNPTYYPGRALFGTAYRGDPQATFYQSIPGMYTDNIFSMPARDRHTDYDFYLSGSGDWNAAGNWGDKSWHRWDMYVKMNTHSGSTWNADGIWQIAYDGHLVFNDQNVQWTTTGSDGYTGWNTIQLGANTNNPCGTDYTTQWVAYDDMVLSNAPIDGTFPGNGSYVIGGGSADATAPAAPTGLSVM